MKKLTKDIFAFSLMFSFCAGSFVYANPPIYLPGNGSFLTLAGGEFNSLFSYKAMLEDYVETDEFRTSSQEEREVATRQLLNDEIKDIAIRIESLVNEIKSARENDPSNNDFDSFWSPIETKLKSLRIAADVLKDSGYQDLANLIVSGLTEVQDLRIFNEDGSLCDYETEEECPASKPIFLADLIKKIENAKVRHNSMNMIEGFSNLQAIPERTAARLTPRDTEQKEQVFKQNDAFFCGMMKSRRARNSIRNGISYFSAGNQDPTHTCRTINLYLTKINGSLNNVQLDPSRESFIEDSSGKKIKIGPAEFKMIKETIK